MLDQEAVLDALYDREKEQSTNHLSSIRTKDFTSGIATAEENLVPKDVFKCLRYIIVYYLSFKKP